MGPTRRRARRPQPRWSLRARVRPAARTAYRRLGDLGRRLLGPGAGAAPAGPDPETPPWLPLPPGGAATCTVCRWQGDAFDGPAHVELSVCPRCGANGRDRFLHWCLARRVDLGPHLRVIECSPRLGPASRAAMTSWFFYRATDHDQRSHAGHLRLDLQAIELPDDCVDVVLCSHVLEHVRDVDKVLSELRRVLAPGGHLLLQVPVLQGRTSPPAAPEVHADATPVHWRFGLDLTGRLREEGFAVDLLGTEELAAAIRSGDDPWGVRAPEFDVPDLLRTFRTTGAADDLVVVADDAAARRFGFVPGYQFLTWDCRVPG